MRLASLIPLLMALAANALATPSVAIDTRLLPQGDIRVGQPLELEIDLLTDTWLTDTPDFSGLQVAQALITFEGSQGRNIQRTIQGKRYFGVTYSYRLIPLEPGVITLPEFELVVAVGQADAPLSARVPEHSFAVQPLPPALADKASLLAGNIRLSQQLQPDTQPLTAGQPLIREVRVEAQRALALSIPPPSAAVENRLVGHSLPAEITPLTDARGRVIGGERIDRIRYTLETAGSYTLPELVLEWWDIDENQLQTANLPALKITVSAAPQRPGQALIAAVRTLFKWFSHYPGGWPGLLLSTSVALWLTYRYCHAIVRNSTEALHHLRSLWANSSVSLKRSAIQQIKASPPDLTGLYRLIRQQSKSVTIRHSTLETQTKQAFLNSLSGCYSATAERSSALAQLLKMIRRFRTRNPSTIQPNALAPLNPRQH